VMHGAAEAKETEKRVRVIRRIRLVSLASRRIASASYPLNSPKQERIRKWPAAHGGEYSWFRHTVNLQVLRSCVLLLTSGHRSGGELSNSAIRFARDWVIRGNRAITDQPVLFGLVHFHSKLRHTRPCLSGECEL
jgi:hypothetical protein